MAANGELRTMGPDPDWLAWQECRLIRALEQAVTVGALKPGPSQEAVYDLVAETFAGVRCPARRQPSGGN